MKNLLLSLFSVLSFSLAAQNSTVTVTVNDSSGLPVHGVSVFFYTSTSQFFANGVANGPVIENFSGHAFTSGNGIATYNVWNPNPNDTVFWASMDCTGNVSWGAGVFNVMNPNLTGTLSLACVPGGCDAVLRVDSFSVPAGPMYYLVEAYPLMEFSRTALPTNIPSLWSINGVWSSGFTAANYDSIMFNTNNFTAPFNVTYARVDSFCTGQSVSFSGGSNPVQLTCNANFWADTLGQTATGYAMAFRNNSTTNGGIINYHWDFGDGNSTSGAGQSNPIHSYASSGLYSVCLTITAVSGNDTCSSTYCDSSVFVPAGGNGGGSQITCNASYMVDTVNSGLFQNQLIIWESSYSNGNVVSYSWDFGDGTTINTQYPSHTYANTGVYGVCLTIVAIDSAGVDTCVSTFCDSIGFDANGNLVYKEGQNGFTINVVDPATVGVDELLLNESLAMYPNPAKGKVQLSWDASLDVQKVAVYTLNGQQVRAFEVNGSDLEISNLPAGAYLVRVETAEASKTLRLIAK